MHNKYNKFNFSFVGSLRESNMFNFVLFYESIASSSLINTKSSFKFGFKFAAIFAAEIDSALKNRVSNPIFILEKQDW
jgi:hypothetical protein